MQFDANLREKTADVPSMVSPAKTESPLLSDLFKKLGKDSHGNPRVPEGIRVYAIGDIHGRADLLSALHERILAHAAEAPPIGRKIVVYLGDYVDRGPESRQVIDTLLDSPLTEFETVCLKGNHDYVMQSFLRDPEIGPDWIRFGGDAALMSYGVNPPLSSARDKLHETQEAFVRALPRSHREFLENLQLYTVIGDYAFVHAGIRPGTRIDLQSVDDLLWIRDPFLRSRKEHDFTIVHGHTICGVPDVRPNRIGIDTGAYASNVLTCLVLEKDGKSFLSTAKAETRRDTIFA